MPRRCPEAAPETPEQLLDALTAIFPSFRGEWESGEVPHSFHGVMLRFTLYFGSASAADLASLGALVDLAIAVDGPLENAVATCFLERLRQVDAWLAFRPHLSEAARLKSLA